jgi:hypothetical protein
MNPQQAPAAPDVQAEAATATAAAGRTPYDTPRLSRYGRVIDLVRQTLPSGPPSPPSRQRPYRR